jgi:crossover junction endodeoxyribonuclease RusA
VLALCSRVNDGARLGSANDYAARSDEPAFSAKISVMNVEFAVIGTPLSQGASPARKGVWKTKVATEAAAAANFGWIGPLAVTLAYFCASLGVDIDNIVKPILDSMKGVLYYDDRQIVQVESFAIELMEATRIKKMTVAIANGLAAGTDFVLVRVAPAKPTEELL